MIVRLEAVAMLHELSLDWLVRRWCCQGVPQVLFIVSFRFVIFFDRVGQSVNRFFFIRLIYRLVISKICCCCLNKKKLVLNWILSWKGIIQCSQFYCIVICDCWMLIACFWCVRCTYVICNYCIVVYDVGCWCCCWMRM